MTEKVEDTDWAMLYAAERRRNIKAMARLAAMMYEAHAFVEAAKSLCDGIFNKDAATVEDLLRLLHWRHDVLANLLLNRVSPPWDVSEAEQQEIDDFLKSEKEPPTYAARLHEYCEQSAKRASAEWHELCHEHRLACVAEMKANDTKEFLTNLRSLVPENLVPVVEDLLSRHELPLHYLLKTSQNK